jgi:hypothetical protein
MKRIRVSQEVGAIKGVRIKLIKKYYSYFFYITLL